MPAGQEPLGWERTIRLVHQTKRACLLARGEKHPCHAGLVGGQLKPSGVWLPSPSPNQADTHHHVGRIKLPQPPPTSKVLGPFFQFRRQLESGFSLCNRAIVCSTIHSAISPSLVSQM